MTATIHLPETRRWQRVWALTLAAALLIGCVYAYAAGWSEIDAGYNLLGGNPTDSICLAGSKLCYSPLTGEAREAYGLPGPDAQGQDRVLTSHVLGAPMGLVSSSDNPALVGCIAYYLAGHTVDPTVCVIDSPDYGYLPYVLG